MKNYTFWIRTSMVIQIITFFIHSTSLILKPQPTNETEKELLGLMNNYQMDMGLGFFRTMGNLMTSFSICFSLLLLFTVLINWYLLKVKVENQVWNGILNIQLMIYFLCFLTMVFFTFLLPIICIGFILSTIGIARWSLRKNEE